MRLTITLLLAVAIVRGQSPGAFTATGSMMTPHGRHTATLLLNGKVLIAGGFQGYILADDPYPSPELYDPSTGAFTATGETDGRVISTATLLPDGRVLMVLFREVRSGLRSVNGAFTATGDMVARTYVTVGRAPLLQDGRVFIARYHGRRNPSDSAICGGPQGQVAGLMQVNVQIPNGVRLGGYVPVVLQVGDASTTPGAGWVAVSGN